GQNGLARLDREARLTGLRQRDRLDRHGQGVQRQGEGGRQEGGGGRRRRARRGRGRGRRLGRASRNLVERRQQGKLLRAARQEENQEAKTYRAELPPPVLPVLCLANQRSCTHKRLAAKRQPRRTHVFSAGSGCGLLKRESPTRTTAETARPTKIGSTPPTKGG